MRHVYIQVGETGQKKAGKAREEELNRFSSFSQTTSAALPTYLLSNSLSPFNGKQRSKKNQGERKKGGKKVEPHFPIHFFASLKPSFLLFSFPYVACPIASHAHLHGGGEIFAIIYWQVAFSRKTIPCNK